MPKAKAVSVKSKKGVPVYNRYRFCSNPRTYVADGEIWNFISEKFPTSRPRLTRIGVVVYSDDKAINDMAIAVGEEVGTRKFRYFKQNKNKGEVKYFKVVFTDTDGYEETACIEEKEASTPEKAIKMVLKETKIKRSDVKFVVVFFDEPD